MAVYPGIWFCEHLREAGASWTKPQNFVFGSIQGTRGLCVYCPRCAEDLHTALEAYRAAHLKDAEAAQ